jgi:acrylyl-CoA reductase (NADPH)
MKTFTAFTIKQQDQELIGQVEQLTQADLSAGNVFIQVKYSSVNFKDALAVQKNGGVIRQYPMIPGIDLSGVVVHSEDERFTQGQPVLVTGYGLGVTHTGGFSEYVQVPAQWVVPLPESLTLKEAMILGTAGFTAALSVMALENNGLGTDKNADIIVTGASGGVGSLALSMFKKLGYTSVTALTRKEAAFDTLTKLGATSCLLLDDFLSERPKPLDKQLFDFAIDTTGGQITSGLLPKMRYDGSIALCGNAAGIKLETTVLPFILRGIHLLGVDSVNVAMPKRLTVWQRLATDLAITDQAVYQEVTLAELPEVFSALMKGHHIGRTIVQIS